MGGSTRPRQLMSCSVGTIKCKNPFSIEAGCADPHVSPGARSPSHPGGPATFPSSQPEDNICSGLYTSPGGAGEISMCVSYLVPPRSKHAFKVLLLLECASFCTEDDLWLPRALKSFGEKRQRIPNQCSVLCFFKCLFIFFNHACLKHHILNSCNPLFGPDWRIASLGEADARWQQSVTSKLIKPSKRIVSLSCIDFAGPDSPVCVKVEEGGQLPTLGCNMDPGNLKQGQPQRPHTLTVRP